MSGLRQGNVNVTELNSRKRTGDGPAAHAAGTGAENKEGEHTTMEENTIQTGRIGQQPVIEAPADSDVLVVAGAGSGKTHTMTERIIHLTTADHVLAENVLGLTFTRKAAAELRDRISKALAKNGTVGGKPGEALLKPSVFTYDAFFQQLVRQYGLLVGMDPNAQPLSSAGASQMIADVVSRNAAVLFAGQDGSGDGAKESEDAGDDGDEDDDSDDDPGGFDNLVRDVRGLADECASSLIGGECQSIGQALDRIVAWDARFLDYLRDLRAGLLDQLRATRDAFAAETAARQASPKSSKAWLKSTKVLGDFVAKLDELIEKYTGDPSDRVKPDTEFGSRLTGFANKAAGEGKGAEDWAFGPLDEAVDYNAKGEALSTAFAARCKLISYYLDVIQHLVWVTRRRDTIAGLVRQFDEDKRRAHVAEFSDFTVAAHRLVTRFPDIGAQCRRRFTHVFLDEYQDTSTTQATLLHLIFHPDGQDGSFVTAVGDPHQAIYGWRGASPGAFRQFEDMFSIPDEERFSLTATRRNPPVVLEAANRVTAAFAKSWERKSSVANREVPVLPLEPAEQAPAAPDDGQAPLMGLAAFGTGAEEVAAVAEFAAQAQRFKTVEETDPDTGQTRSVQRTPVAILFRSKKPMTQYADALARRGLTYQVVGAGSLMGRPDIADLRATLLTVADHADTPALQQLLASPRFAVSPAAQRALARQAARGNTDFQYRALLQMGRVANPFDETSEKERDEAVRRARDEQGIALPTGVYLADVVLADDLDAQLEKAKILGEDAARIREAARILRTVEKAAGRGLREELRAASAALTLRSDSALAHAIDEATRVGGLPGSGYGAAFDALMDQERSYEGELPDTLHADAAGFFAWMDSMSQQPAEPEPDLGDVPDAVLMTIHQAKGLEWPAVAVVDMRRGVLPSKGRAGDGITVSKPDDIPWDEQNGPSYQVTRQSWLENPTKAPALLRVDATLLPAFPHDGNADFTSTPASLNTVTQLEQEAIGALNQAGVPTMPDPPLSQREEYGRLGLDEERRLAYVALTRAKKQAILMCSTDKNPARTPAWSAPMTLAANQEGDTPTPDDALATLPHAADGCGGAPSVYWSELFHAYADPIRAARKAADTDADTDGDTDGDETPMRDVPRAESPVTPTGTATDAPGADTAWETRSGEPVTLMDDDVRRQFADRAHPSATGGLYADLPDGYALPDGVFAGRDAAALSQALTRAAFDESVRIRKENQKHTTPWPGDLTAPIRAALTLTARAVDALDADDPTLWNAIDTDQKNTGRQPTAGDTASPLLERARALAAADTHDEAGDDLIARANAARQGTNISTTSLRATAAANLTAEGAHAAALGILRPMPKEPSWSSTKGTLFHDWARGFLACELPGGATGALADDAFPDGAVDGDDALGLDGQARRKAMVKAIGADTTLTAREKEWRRRLAASPWALRVPFAVELPITVTTAAGPVNGTLDAVFLGGLNPDDLSDPSGAAYTVVDWKTGRKPATPEDRDRFAAQLDVYRLLFSRQYGVPLDSIDAALYFVAEKDPADRLMTIPRRTEDEIVAEIAQGRYVRDFGAD